MKVLHPLWFSKIAPFLAQQCTIVQRDTEVGVSGVPSGEWLPVEGLAGIACAVGVRSGGKRLQPDMTPIITDQQIALGGYYPQVKEQMRAVVGSDTFEIMLVEHNSTGEMTLLSVEKVVV